ncbi:hypothetical protein TanjilG_13407 [Lupinus angustifolius]|uniref:Uncharacterized protein n=1 Tax=Lupinus angustifolius TaxID=3871 RepID=A0A4P1RV66_LUPAN|nr:hypothetical protein TanjilG_13407 [Lupinus angustifolius]
MVIACTASRASSDFNQPRVNASAVKDVAATGELPAPLAVAKSVEADNATGFGSGFGSPGDAEAREAVEVAGGVMAEAVEGAAEEEDVEEEEGGETDEEEEEGGEEEHDDWFEEKGEKVGVWFGMRIAMNGRRRRHD